MLFKIVALKNFAIFTGKHLCWSLLFNKTPATLLKKRLQHRCFPVNIAKILRAFFLEHFRWLLLKILRIANFSNSCSYNMVSDLQVCINGSQSESIPEIRFIDEKLTQLNITLVEVKANEVKAENILKLDSHENGRQRENEISNEKHSGKKEDMKEEVEIPTKKMKKDTHLNTKHKKLNNTSKSNKESKIKISLCDDRGCPVLNNKTDVDNVFIKELREDGNVLKKKKVAAVSNSRKKVKYNLDGKGFTSKANGHKSEGETKEEPIFLSRTVKIFKIASVGNAENHETQKIEKQAKQIKRSKKSKFSSVKFPASSHGDDQPIGLATSNDNVIDRKERLFNPVVRMLDFVNQIISTRVVIYIIYRNPRLTLFFHPFPQLFSCASVFNIFYAGPDLENKGSVRYWPKRALLKKRTPKISLPPIQSLF